MGIVYILTSDENYEQEMSILYYEAKKKNILAVPCRAKDRRFFQEPDPEQIKKTHPEPPFAMRRMIFLSEPDLSPVLSPGERYRISMKKMEDLLKRLEEYPALLQLDLQRTVICFRCIINERDRFRNDDRLAYKKLRDQVIERLRALGGNYVLFYYKNDYPDLEESQISRKFQESLRYALRFLAEDSAETPRIPPCPLLQEEAMDAASYLLSNGQAHRIALLGEPGIGKEVFLRQLADRMEEKGWKVIRNKSDSGKMEVSAQELLERIIRKLEECLSVPGRDLRFPGSPHGPELALEEYMESLSRMAEEKGMNILLAVDGIYTLRGAYGTEEGAKITGGVLHYMALFPEEGGIRSVFTHTDPDQLHGDVEVPSF